MVPGFLRSGSLVPRSKGNPEGPGWGIARTIRGGSFASSTSGWSKGYRSSMAPDQRSRYTGFRVCRTAPDNVQPKPHAEEPNWFQPYNQAPKGFETATGKLSPLLNADDRAITTTTQWSDKAAQLKTKWKNLLGTCPADIPSPAIRIIQTFHEPAYLGTLAALQVEPDASEDVFIMEPNRPSEKPRPAVIVPFYDVDPAAGKDMEDAATRRPVLRALPCWQFSRAMLQLRCDGSEKVTANRILKRSRISPCGIPAARVWVNGFPTRARLLRI